MKIKILLLFIVENRPLLFVLARIKNDVKVAKKKQKRRRRKFKIEIMIFFNIQKGLFYKIT